MVDFREIINNTFHYNFHSHTQYCDGRATMEDFVIEAIKQGFLHYGFSPHSPVPVESTCNMCKTDALAYLAEVDRLREKYGDRITLYASMEVDFIDGWGPALPYFQEMPLDYIIGSVHFIPSKHDATEFIDIDGSPETFIEKMHKYFDDDIEWVVKSYFSQVNKMIEAGGFDIIGHFDKISYNSSCFKPGIDKQPWFCDLRNDTFAAIMKHNYVVEVNTKAWETKKWLFPSVDFFETLRASGATVLFNSDAHYTNLINAGRDEARKLFYQY